MSILSTIKRCDYCVTAFSSPNFDVGNSSSKATVSTETRRFEREPGSSRRSHLQEFDLVVERRSSWYRPLSF